MHPREAMKRNNICPVCGKKMTIGVQHRVEELADRDEGFTPSDAIPFKRVIPLAELIAVALGSESLHTQKVKLEYDRLVKRLGSEYRVLLETSLESLLEVTHPKVAELIILNREERLKIKPGFDGVYGKIVLEEQEETAEKKVMIGQQRLDNYFKV